MKAQRLDIRAEQAACPLVAKHTNGPSGYVQWHQWAARRAETHVCRKCPGCGYWMIWETK